MTRTDLDVIGDAVGAALTAKLKVRDERLDRLEDLARGTTPARAAASTARGTKKLSSRTVCCWQLSQLRRRVQLSQAADAVTMRNIGRAKPTGLVQ